MMRVFRKPNTVPAIDNDEGYSSEHEHACMSGVLKTFTPRVKNNYYAVVRLLDAAVDDDALAGFVVSVPVVYFNNAGGWKKQFPNPKHTFMVCLVEYHHNASRIELCCLGTPSSLEENFFVNAVACNKYRELWLAHGERMTPSYVVDVPVGGKYVDLSDDVFDKQPDKQLRSTTTKQTSLYTKYPEYEIDWTDFPPERNKAQILQLSGDEPAMLQPETYVITRLLQETLLRIVSQRAPWRWEKNSCHLDCWLMIQLAFFGHLTKHNPKAICDDFVLSNEPLKKLFQVLLSGGTPTQDNLKMGYWAMEIEEYDQGSRRARKTFGQPLMHSAHADYLQEATTSAGGPELGKLLIGTIIQCNNPLHEDSPLLQRAITHVPVDDFWYSMPDDWVRVKDDQNHFHLPTSHQHKHEDLGDVVQTMIGRTEGETKSCNQCTVRYPGSAFQTKSVKRPDHTMMPLSLEFAVDPHQIMHAAQEITVGGLRYTLLAVVFGNNAHFTCNVKLDGVWYHYDGMGIRSAPRPKQENLTYPRIPRLVRAETILDVPDKDGANKKYTPVSYRYIRETDAAALKPVYLKAVDEVHTETQFSNMWRLFVEGY